MTSPPDQARRRLDHELHRLIARHRRDDGVVAVIGVLVEIVSASDDGAAAAVLDRLMQLRQDPRRDR